MLKLTLCTRCAPSAVETLLVGILRGRCDNCSADEASGLRGYRLADILRALASVDYGMSHSTDDENAPH